MSRLVLRLAATLATVCALLPHTLPAATELHLKNGDTLRGEHLKTENGLIHFKSPVLGTILIPAIDAKIINVPDTPVESLVGLPPAKSAAPAEKPSGSAPTAGTTQSAAAKNAPPAPKPKWKGKIEFGYQQQSGRRDMITGSLRVDAESAAKTANLLKASGRVLYGKQNNQVNSERYEASFRWRHELSERTFTQTLTSYFIDRVKHIDHNFEQNAGLGYRFLQRGRHILNAGLGGTGQYRETNGLPEDWIYLSEFFQDYSYKISGRLTLLQESGVLYSTKPILHGNVPAENYRFRFNTSLQGRVSERVSLNLRYEYEYDNSIANKTLRADQRVTSSIGYAL
ncbi:hypothetical protein CMV30_09720 [Nibricoccus aquaticus]|uniref:DUF481 domain-containing protein n=1 Tax=Nibricoccus aquaticus TaxID=2576891 RepID=A0A290QIP4_9BACT|nr:DUF481 domain-containing protein [Nibricoccus aquaticus]ATC64211.1 hypothetical protein CMV30_09720 [Nibricoccus aquaticus]